MFYTILLRLFIICFLLKDDKQHVKSLVIIKFIVEMWKMIFLYKERTEKKIIDSEKHTAIERLIKFDKI